MKTIKTFIAMAAVSLLALSDAHAGGFLDDVLRDVMRDRFTELRPMFPEEHPTRCWPKLPDPRVVQIEPSFAEILPRVPKCVPIDPRAHDALGLSPPTLRTFQYFSR